LHSEHQQAGRIIGRIVRKLRDRFEVSIDGRMVDAVASGSLRYRSGQTETHNRGRVDRARERDRPIPIGRDHRRPKPVRSGKSAAGGAGSAGAAIGDLVVGDEVVLRGVTDFTQITEILPRRNKLARKAAGKKEEEQVIAANLDLLVIAASAAEPPLSPALIDRYLVEAESDGLAAIVCVTKSDLRSEEEILATLAPQRAAGYEVLLVSALLDQGTAELAARLRGRTAVLAGKSGAGKSTLVNALLGTELAASEISASTGKGRHTTSEVRMLPWPEGGGIIDTPGVREFGLWEVPRERLASCFPEMRPLLGRCRFGVDCLHVEEPECAVKEAVRAGRIHRARYRSYCKLGGFAEEAAETTHDSFTCRHCGWAVSSQAVGTQHRNHCPRCLWSLHLDDRPGDRASGCRGEMEPIAIQARTGGEWSVLQRCTECGVIKANRIAGDDNEWLLLSLAARPLSRPPFPVDRMEVREERG
jgi:ribosome biogenesis GTPase / thiamine phosphate phosphatase